MTISRADYVPHNTTDPANVYPRTIGTHHFQFLRAILRLRIGNYPGTIFGHTDYKRTYRELNQLQISLQVSIVIMTARNIRTVSDVCQLYIYICGSAKSNVLFSLGEP